MKQLLQPLCTTVLHWQPRPRGKLWKENYLTFCFTENAPFKSAGNFATSWVHTRECTRADILRHSGNCRMRVQVRLKLVWLQRILVVFPWDTHSAHFSTVETSSYMKRDFFRSFFGSASSESHTQHVLYSLITAIMWRRRKRARLFHLKCIRPGFWITCLVTCRQWNIFIHDEYLLTENPRYYEVIYHLSEFFQSTVWPYWISGQVLAAIRLFLHTEPSGRALREVVDGLDIGGQHGQQFVLLRHTHMPQKWPYTTIPNLRK